MTTREEMDEFLAAVFQAASQPDNNPEVEALRQKVVAGFAAAEQNLIRRYAPWSTGEVKLTEKELDELAFLVRLFARPDETREEVNQRLWLLSTAPTFAEAQMMLAYSYLPWYARFCPGWLVKRLTIREIDKRIKMIDRMIDKE